MAKRITISKAEADRWNRLLDLGMDIDFEKENVQEDTTLFGRTVLFEDGCFANLRVCSGQTNLWCEVVWFDKDGDEMCCSDACADTLEGMWECSRGEQYNVEVVGE